MIRSLSNLTEKMFGSWSFSLRDRSHFISSIRSIDKLKFAKSKFYKSLQIYANIKFFIRSILIWTLSYFILAVLQLSNSVFSEEFISVHLHYILWSGLLIGLIWGIVFKIFLIWHRLITNYLLYLLLTAMVNVISAILMVFCHFFMWEFIRLDEMPQTMTQLVQFYRSPIFYTLLIHSFIVVILFHFVYKMNQKLGHGILLKFLMGSYYNPKEELRVFMFMDLKSSTHYAEKLGHFKYSRLIQDCFNHLTEVVINNNANIYQYVGDEVVLTWKIDKNYDAMQSIKSFYDFNDVLESKREYYLTQYGMMPVFKAGLHAGKVMVAQVGHLKSEIAYHGDAINTASRVQNLCNKYQSRLLMTGDFLNYFKLFQKATINTSIRSMGKIKLDGKEALVDLYNL